MCFFIPAFQVRYGLGRESPVHVRVPLEVGRVGPQFFQAAPLTEGPRFYLSMGLGLRQACRKWPNGRAQHMSRGNHPVI